MEKIEAYDRFVKDLGQYYDTEPLVYALDYCHREAFEHKDKDILRLILTDDYPYPKVKAMLERERHGERCIPDYLWKAIGKWIRELSLDWLKQAKFYERPPKLIDKEMDELKDIKRKMIETEFPEIMWYELFNRRRELDPQWLGRELGCAYPVNKYYFRHEYFRGRMPSYKKPNYKEQVRALNDLSERHLRFAEMFEE